MEMPFTSKKEFVEFCNKSLGELDEKKFPYTANLFTFTLRAKIDYVIFLLCWILFLMGLSGTFKKSLLKPATHADKILTVAAPIS
jgi:hypothetical protein